MATTSVTPAAPAPAADAFGTAPAAPAPAAPAASDPLAAATPPAAAEPAAPAAGDPLAAAPPPAAAEPAAPAAIPATPRAQREPTVAVRSTTPALDKLNDSEAQLQDKAVAADLPQDVADALAKAADANAINAALEQLKARTLLVDQTFLDTTKDPKFREVWATIKAKGLRLPDDFRTMEYPGSNGTFVTSATEYAKKNNRYNPSDLTVPAYDILKRRALHELYKADPSTLPDGKYNEDAANQAIDTKKLPFTPLEVQRKTNELYREAFLNVNEKINLMNKEYAAYTLNFMKGWVNLESLKKSLGPKPGAFGDGGWWDQALQNYGTQALHGYVFPKKLGTLEYELKLQGLDDPVQWKADRAATLLEASQSDPTQTALSPAKAAREADAQYDIAKREVVAYVKEQNDKPVWDRDPQYVKDVGSIAKSGSFLSGLLIGLVMKGRGSVWSVVGSKLAAGATGCVTHEGFMLENMAQDFYSGSKERQQYYRDHEKLFGYTSPDGLQPLGATLNRFTSTCSTGFQWGVVGGLAAHAIKSPIVHGRDWLRGKDVPEVAPPGATPKIVTIDGKPVTPPKAAGAGK